MQHCSWQFSHASSFTVSERRRSLLLLLGAGHRKESFREKSGSLSILRQAEQER